MIEKLRTNEEIRVGDIKFLPIALMVIVLGVCPVVALAVLAH